LFDDAKKEENWDCVSAADEPLAFNEKLDSVEIRKKPKQTMFDKSEFLQEVFPPLRIQKPGYDIYARTTFTLILILLFVFMFFSKFTV